MKTGKFYVILMALLLLMPSLISINPINHTTNNYMTTKPMSPKVKDIPSVDTVSEITRTNIMENPSFERTTIRGTPIDYYSSGSAYAHTNFSYKDDVHTGAQAACIEGEATNSSSNYASFYQYISGNRYLSESQTLDAYYNIQKPGPIDNDAYTYIQITTTNSSYYRIYVYYVISYGTFAPSNWSNSIYFMLNSTLNSWNHLTRNITQDLLSAIPSTATDLTRRVESVYVSLTSYTGNTERMSSIFDDFRILNGTGYNILANSGFENTNPTNWNANNYSPSHIGRSADCTDGKNALNITIASIGQGHTGYAYTQRAFYNTYDQFLPTTEQSVKIAFDWKYSDVYNGGGQYAFAGLRLVNDTGSFYLYYLLGADRDTYAYSNSTTELYFEAQSFGTRDQWNHFSRDISADLASIGWKNVSLYRVQFYTYLGNHANSSVQLLVDAVEVKAYTFGDPGFESIFRDTSSDRIATWYRQSGDASRVTRSTDRHSGEYSANLTAENNQYSSISRFNFFTPVDAGLYFDVSWKIVSMTSPPTGDIYARIGLYFEGGYTLYYFLAKSASLTLTNDSYNSYINVKNFNTTGTWFTNHMNITDHLNASFGEHIWNLTEIQIWVYASSGNKIVFLLDDIGLVDVIPPTISSVSHTPASPMYYEPVEVTVNAQDDRASVKTVTVYYRTTGSWTAQPASESDGHYTATIPAQGYNATVEYYVEVTDWSGNSVIDNNGGSYYSYTVGDDVNPTVSLDHPVNGTTVTGEAWLNVTADDAGSGIDYVEFKIDGVSVYNDTTAPFALYWNSRTVSNGSRTLTVVAHDVAGHVSEDFIVINVQNDVAPPELTYAIINPSEPQYGEDVTISVGALDVSGVENVTLFYRMNGGSWTSVLMTQSGILYSHVIPGQPYGTEVEYYIVAYDIYGTSDSIGSSSNPRSYTVSDRIAPVLSVSGPSTTEPVMGTVAFQVTANDLGSGIDRVEFKVDGTTVESKAGGTFNWNTLDFENGNYTLTFTAYDNAGNTVTFSIEYQVHNPVGIEGITASLSSLMAQYGFILGAATVVIILVVIKIIARKRGSA
ncbi:MAG: Ig-like domain-containing protein [Candidatus Thorarchaeota archaeon]|nr:Ig-like domain-containing protein [Candidatus Thorarchaeota archaeon]